MTWTPGGAPTLEGPVRVICSNERVFQQKGIFAIRVKKCCKITQQTSYKKFIGGGEQKAASEQGWKTETYWVAMVGFRQGIEHAQRKILPVTRETQVCWHSVIEGRETLVLECGQFLAD